MTQPPAGTTIRAILALSVAAIVGACASGRALSRGYSPASAARAVIGERGARFVFPAEDADSIAWPSRPPNAYDGELLQYWEVDWHRGLGYERFGVDPQAINFSLRWKRTTTLEWALNDLLKQSAPEVFTFCKTCGTPAVTVQLDRSVTATFENRRVVFWVHGRDAVHKIFPNVPDSVTFTRHILSGNEEHDRVVAVAVEHAEPRK